jgi:ribosomal protein S18 acetylase RimI-like enzyme
MTIIIRSLEDDELEALDEITKLAFQTPVSHLQDMRFYRKVEPDGWFAAVKDGRLAGMVGAISYESFAHIGVLVVHPDLQHQGIGKALMHSLFAWLEQRQVPAAWLDASDMGRPLYEKLGFAIFGMTASFKLRDKLARTDRRPAGLQPITPDDLDELVRLDRVLFGANRRKVFQVMLDLFPGRAFLKRDAQGQIDGYIFVQEFRIGPWAALHRAAAEELLQAALSLPYKDNATVYVPTENRAAMELVQQYGFEKTVISPHMGFHAEGIPGQRQQIYAQTSLAAG